MKYAANSGDTRLKAIGNITRQIPRIGGNFSNILSAVVLCPSFFSNLLSF